MSFHHSYLEDNIIKRQFICQQSVQLAMNHMRCRDKLYGNSEVNAIWKEIWPTYFDGAHKGGQFSYTMLKRYPDALDPQEHWQVRRDVRIRFGNPMMEDTLVRVAKDPIRKLGPGDRLIGSARLCLEEGIFPENIARVCGAALCYDFEGDVESLKRQVMIRAQGIEKTLEQVSHIKIDVPLGQKIIEFYHDWQES